MILARRKRKYMYFKDLLLAVLLAFRIGMLISRYQREWFLWLG